jgi:hypothetical protein
MSPVLREHRLGRLLAGIRIIAATESRFERLFPNAGLPRVRRLRVAADRLHGGTLRPRLPRDPVGRYRKLGEDKATTVQAMRLFEDSGTEAPQLGIPRGSFNRTILGVLRDAREPLSTRGIAEGLAGEKALDKRQTNLLVARVRNSLPRISDQLDGKLIERTTFWRLKSGS